MKEIFYLKKKLFCFQDTLIFLFFMNPQTFKFMTSSKTLLHIKKYVFCCFSWMLLSTEMKLGEMLVKLMINISNIFLVQLWSLEAGSRPFYDFQKLLISWRQFIFSCWWLTILIATVHTIKRTKNVKLIISCWVIATSLKLKKGLEIGPSFQNQTKKELEMFVESCTNISPSFILIINRIQEKQ